MAIAGYLRYPRAVTKVLVSFEDTLLRRIDRFAQSRGLTRSSYLASLAERDLKHVHGPGSSPRARRALGRLDKLFGAAQAGDATAAIRAERDAR